jgi:hypothetical protein
MRNRRIERTILAVLLLTPSVSLASGDVGQVWEVLAGFLLYAFVASLLVFQLVKRRISPIRLGAFVAASATVWYWYGNTRPPHHVLEFVFLLLVPLVFLIRASRHDP